MPDNPAGWYPDPAGDPNLLRYWDGTQWSAQTQQKQVIAPPDQRKRRNTIGIAGFVCGIISTLAVVYVLFFSSSALSSMSSALGEAFDQVIFFIWVISALFAIILSAIGLRRLPRGFAVAGLVMGILNLLLLGLVFFLLIAFIRGGQLP